MLKNLIFTPIFTVNTPQKLLFSQQKRLIIVNYIIDIVRFIDEMHNFMETKKSENHGKFKFKWENSDGNRKSNLPQLCQPKNTQIVSGPTRSHFKKVLQRCGRIY